EHEVLNNSRRLAKLEKFIQPPGDLLDVGGGIGTLTALAIERGWDATNLEPIDEAVDYAKQRGIPTIKGGIEDVEPKQRFDAITMMHVLEHLPRSREALQKAGAVMRPGGHIMIEVPHYNAMCRRVKQSDWLGWWPGQHIYYWTTDTIADLVRRAGFEVLDVRTMVLYFDGLFLDHYAYILGLAPAFRTAMSIKRRLFGGEVSTNGGSAKGGQVGAPALRDQPLSRRWLTWPLEGIARKA
ncbi:MAG: class I SAM-dependent methyltransferase, partial [Actinobacteria bacterium]|nr:class I SAM-dependent methyltransferase [Actinomycetota bacterium]